MTHTDDIGTINLAESILALRSMLLVSLIDDMYVPRKKNCPMSVVEARRNVRERTCASWDIKEHLLSACGKLALIEAAGVTGGILSELVFGID